MATALALYVAVRSLGLLALAVGAAADGVSAHERLIRWDAQWYAPSPAHGYGLTGCVPDGRHLSDVAFFPLYPGLERAGRRRRRAVGTSTPDWS